MMVAGCGRGKALFALQRTQLNFSHFCNLTPPVLVPIKSQKSLINCCVRCSGTKHGSVPRNDTEYAYLCKKKTETNG